MDMDLLAEAQRSTQPTKSAQIRAKLRAGKTPKQIHAEMGVSYSTIRSASKHGDKRGAPRGPRKKSKPAAT